MKFYLFDDNFKIIGAVKNPDVAISTAIMLNCRVGIKPPIPQHKLQQGSDLRCSICNSPASDVKLQTVALSGGNPLCCTICLEVASE